MAKVIAPFKLSGTLDDINFVNTPAGNIARMKREKFMTSKEFMENPIYDRIREQGKEMGYASGKSRIFRLLAGQFYKKSKDLSFAGRANKIILEILKEDNHNPKGKRTLEEGMKSQFLHEILLGFEGNKNKPLSKVLLSDFEHFKEQRTIQIADFIPKIHLDWPKEATHAHLALALANWDFASDSFDTCYSEEIICDKESEKQNILLTSENPKGNQCLLTYLFIGFAKKERSKYTLLHRRNNTVSIIACKMPEELSKDKI
ncbi:hypothetical protein [Flavobacterium aquicola]|uniref:Uncharacterized protein n=1 Tax=Flavobacterium aquicola TaxID=1682742 RepID=A0A3E0EJ86_9FLAO|nr:hypothetical protein [Flavobacterium aquicola]REG98258.1 hypothetical protein C8P67_107185 [Flavobacterium aquicola]